MKHGEIPPAPLYDKRGDGKKVLFTKWGKPKATPFSKGVNIIPPLKMGTMRFLKQLWIGEFGKFNNSSWGAKDDCGIENG